MLTSYYFSIPDIRCASCCGPIEQALHQCGIDQFDIDITDKSLHIELPGNTQTQRQSIERLHRALEDCGFSLKEQAWLKWLRQMHRFFAFIGLAGGGVLMLLSLLSLPISWPVLITIASICTLATLLIGAESLYYAAIKLVKSRTLTMDTLFAISTITVLSVSIASLFVPWLPMMFDVALLIYGFRHLGQVIEESIKHSLACAIRFQDRIPSQVEKIVHQQTLWVAVDELSPGDIIRVPPGQVVPVDGQSSLDSIGLIKTIVNGSLAPITVLKDEEVLAGTEVPIDAAPLLLTVSKPAEQSYLACLDKEMSLERKKKAPLVSKTEHYLHYFIPIVMGVAIVTAIAVGLFFTPALAIQCAVAILVSACPCTLGFITPFAMKIGLHKAASYGVHYKNANELEKSSHIDTVVFDLNGTLTHAKPRIVGLKWRAPTSAHHQLLRYIYAIESQSSHYLAACICDYVKQQGLNLEEKVAVTALDTRYHAGIGAQIEGKTYVLGNADMMKIHGIALDDEQDDKQIIYVACDGQLVAQLAWDDTLREDAPAAIEALKKLKKNVYLCTGADEKTAVRFAKKLGIDATCVYADCGKGGKNKKDYIHQLRQQGRRVAMVGDGSNDGPAIGASDFSIAMKSIASDVVTRGNAGALIEENTLMPAVNGLVIAQQTMTHMKQNLVLSLSYNLSMVALTAVLLLTVGMALNPAVGVALMIVQSSLLLLNAYRFKRQKLQHLSRRSKPDDLGVNHFIAAAEYKPALKPLPRVRLTSSSERCSSPRTSTFWRPASEEETGVRQGNARHHLQPAQQPA